MKTIIKGAGAFITSIIIIICFAIALKLDNQSDFVLYMAIALSCLTIVYFGIKFSSYQDLVSSDLYWKMIKKTALVIIISAMAYFTWVSIATFPVTEKPHNLRYIKGFIYTDSANTAKNRNDEQLFLHFSDGQPSQMGETWKGWTIVFNQIGIAGLYFIFTISLSAFVVHAFFKNEIYSVNKFKDRINSINWDILKNSKSQFDLGSFLETSLKISTKNIAGEANNAILPQAKSFMNDDLRRKIIDAIKGEKNISAKEMQDLLKSLLRRTILYVGCECERQGYIGVEAEYTALQQALKSEYMELIRVIKPTIKNLMSDWDKQRPSVIFISCHGSSNGLFLTNEEARCREYTNTDFLGFFRPKILYTECVILSACESLSLAKMIIDHCRNVVCINRKVDIKTAGIFCNVYMEYLNDHSLQNNHVYKDAFDFAKSYVKFEGLQDSFAFEFLKAEVIDN